ncbi:hypothetical protein [Dickeya chrysanthemi]|uniref:hypothetical protein n=1 Tax=Dickeya chrysanthemi TaxID=556 RepID=UPI001CF47E83|nr:hypothetical protein [Dickeya chrysanthemi]MCA7009323.1 hypothetical protein [Dickeya chrysanthemi]
MKLLAGASPAFSCQTTFINPVYGLQQQQQQQQQQRCAMYRGNGTYRMYIGPA